MHWILIALLLLVPLLIALLALGVLVEVALLAGSFLFFLIEAALGLIGWVFGLALAVVVAVFKLGLLAALVFGLVVLWGAWRLMRRGPERADDPMHDRVRRGMDRMDRRMRNLETILDERTRGCGRRRGHGGC